MSIFSDIFRRRQRTNHPDGSRSVVVTDRHGNVRKTKHKGPSGTFKQRFDRSGRLHKSKQKGPGIARAKRRHMTHMDPRMVNSINQMQLRNQRAEEDLMRLQEAYAQLQSQMVMQQISNMPTFGEFNIDMQPYTSPNTGMTVHPTFDINPSTGGMRKGGSKKRRYGKGGSKKRGPNGIL
tara:strand:+ start:432 stop:968 length:537 start_codon:yes stop_codon:yes gene_type:complete